MLPDGERAKLRFDLANANLQSIGRAQGFYVTALLAYICLAWGAGNGEISFHLAWLDLKVAGIWGITPFVLLILTLCYIGTITAAMPAFKRLQEVGKEVFGAEEHSMSSLETHKNMIDYLVVLQLNPRTETRTPTDDVEPPPISRRIPHLILPIIFIGSAVTSFWAAVKLSQSGSSLFVILFGWSCVVIQIAYSVRPVCRFGARFLGANRTSTYFN